MARSAAFLVAAILGLCGPALADGPGALVAAGDLHGEYRFDSLTQRNGQPICSEQWSFAADGVLTVHSGQEVVSQSNRVQLRQVMNAFDHKPIAQSELLLSNTHSNRQPDCLGYVSSSVGEADRVNIVYRTANGGIVLCVPMSGAVLRPLGILRPVSPAPEGAP